MAGYEPNADGQVAQKPVVSPKLFIILHLMISNEFKTLAKLLSSHPKSIEIIPGDGKDLAWISDLNSSPQTTEVSSTHKPFLWMDRNLGVPQKCLFKLYIEAVDVYNGLRANGVHCTETSALLEATSVILLANPSHQTALNARKRVVIAEGINADDELAFIAGLLTLKHSAKVSTLWHHRRWLLLRQLSPVQSDVSDIGTMDIDDRFCSYILPFSRYQTEIEISKKACDIYPRNYYAWMHRRLILRSLVYNLTINASIPASSSKERYHSAFVQELSESKTYIGTHISDFSAVHHLCQSLVALYRSSLELDTGVPLSTESMVEDAMTLVKTYPNHESLWLYLRLVISMHNVFQKQSPVVDNVLCREQDGMDLSAERLAEQFAKNTDTGTADEQAIQRHAQSFIKWSTTQKKAYVASILAATL